MKKLLLFALITALLLTACDNSSHAKPTFRFDPIENTSNITVKVTEENFIKLSAKILCLSTKHPDATDEEIETLSKNILISAHVDEEDFSAYQQSIEVNQASREKISGAILKKMEQSCTNEDDIQNEKLPNQDSDLSSLGMTEAEHAEILIDGVGLALGNMALCQESDNYEECTEFINENQDSDFVKALGRLNAPSSFPASKELFLVYCAELNFERLDCEYFLRSCIDEFDNPPIQDCLYVLDTFDPS